MRNDKRQFGFKIWNLLIPLLLAAVLLLSVSCSSISNLVNAIWPASEKEDSKNATGVAGISIAIDPGHGGIDGGTSGEDSGVLEAELNLLVSKLLEDRFQEAGATVLMTRESDDVSYDGSGDTMKLKDMDHRVKLVQAQSPHVLVSVHMNTFSDRTVRGAQVFFQKDSGMGEDLARAIQEELNAGVNEKKKRSAQAGDYYMLRETDCPGVIVECGFLSNPDDEKQLQDPEHQAKLAECIYKGVCKYLGVE